MGQRVPQRQQGSTAGPVYGAVERPPQQPSQSQRLWGAASPAGAAHPGVQNAAHQGLSPAAWGSRLPRLHGLASRRASAAAQERMHRAGHGRLGPATGMGRAIGGVRPQGQQPDREEASPPRPGAGRRSRRRGDGRAAAATAAAAPPEASAGHHRACTVSQPTGTVATIQAINNS